MNGLLDRAAQEGGERTALIAGEREVSFADLRREVLSLAEGLRRAGAAKGARLAIVHRNAPEFVAAYFAALRLGAIAVPLNFLIHKPDELAYLLNDCGAFGVVTQAEFLPGLKAAAARCPALRALWVTDRARHHEGDELVKPFADLRGPAAEEFNADAASAEDVAAVLYTSGTTGRPKGAMLTHRNLVSNCASSLRRMGLTRRDVSVCILPMFHSFAWTGLVLVSLRLAIPCVIAHAVAPAKPWLQAMGRHGVTLIAAVPQVYAALAREAKSFEVRWFLRLWAFRRVRVAVSGAAPLPAATARAFEAAVGVPILEGWGLTETSPVATVNPPGRAKPGSVGPAIDGVRLKVVDEEERELPVGQDGEICVQGENVMKGYWGLPEDTAAAFTKDGWFKTGDIGALDADDYLAIHDRKKDMVIVKGLKVFPAQVEAVIAEHPDVAESAVIGVPDSLGDETLKAFVVPKSGHAPEKAELLRFFKERLDHYKRPRDVELVAELPKNALHKVLKRVLRERELQKRGIKSVNHEDAKNVGN
ncbi:MAG: long-chain-fatty-acid--CoA ligase [Elusimicrobia bacterium]|nr:long-chain-fatty-acid--CoA ligase [Elusimicrobiota bacterium]